MIIFQSLLTICISLYVLKVSAFLLDSRLKALFIMLAYATSELLMWDIFPQSDGVYTNTFVFFSFYALYHHQKNTVMHFLLLGSLFGYLFLVRDVTLYMTLLIFPALLYLHKKYVFRVGTFLIPLISIYIIYGSFNKNIYGDFFISSSGQFVPVQALLRLAEKGVPIFDGDSVVDRTMRQSLKQYNLTDLYTYNDLLLKQEGLNPRQIDQLNKKKYFQTWQRFPVEMTLQTIRKFGEKFSTIAFNPLLNSVEVSRANFEEVWPKKWVQVQGLTDIIFYLTVNLCRLVSVIIFTLSIVVILSIYLKSPIIRAKMLWCYAIMASFACVYCPTHIEARYIMSIIPLMILVVFLGFKDKLTFFK